MPPALLSRQFPAMLRLFFSFSRPNSPFFSLPPPVTRRFLSPTSASSRAAHFQSKSLRLLDASELEPTPSRNEKKREARRAFKWGIELATFSIPQIKRILRVASLDQEVLEALMLVKKLGSDVREGKRRQFNYIGRLLRNVEPELMDALILASKDGDNTKLQSIFAKETLADDEDKDEDKEIEYGAEEKATCDYAELASRWYEGLLIKDSSITKEVYSIHNVEFDRQELRKLIRSVHLVEEEHSLVDESEDGEPMTMISAKKSLIKFLQTLAKQTLTCEQF